MIFVTVGTQDKQFIRLLQAVDKAIEDGFINEEVIVQAGCNDYQSDNMKIMKMLSQQEFEKYINECSLLITHGGVGSIMTGLKYGKKVIAAARLAKYHEAERDHQEEIIRKFENDGNILGALDLDKLGEVVEKARDFEPKPYVSNTANMVRLIEDFIDNN